MSDTTNGIYAKYSVERTDGSSAPGGRHERCAYFVLDLEHDPFAFPALRAYAEACAATHPGLARDLFRICGARDDVGLLSPSETAELLMMMRSKP